MSRIDDRTRLRHMLDAARRVVELTANRSRGDLDRDDVIALAVVRLIEITGEAARGVSGLLRADHPEVPWKQLIGTRDRVAHAYFAVDLDIVWRISTRELPVLIEQLENILESGRLSP